MIKKTYRILLLVGSFIASPILTTIGVCVMGFVNLWNLANLYIKGINARHFVFN